MFVTNTDACRCTGTILANDILPKAYASIARNIDFNGLDPKRVVASNADAAALMFASREPKDQFDIIDLDPYGAPVLFLDSAVQVGFFRLVAAEPPLFVQI